MEKAELKEELKDSYMEKKTWREFQKCGMLWFVNRILQVFGWVIVVTVIGDEVIEVVPCRTKYRGFAPEVEDQEFLKVTKYMAENSQELLKEVEE